MGAFLDLARTLGFVPKDPQRPRDFARNRATLSTTLKSLVPKVFHAPLHHPMAWLGQRERPGAAGARNMCGGRQRWWAGLLVVVLVAHGAVRILTRNGSRALMCRWRHERKGVVRV